MPYDLKKPPQNIEAEESLLCSCLLEDPADVIDLLVPEDFYKSTHNRIFRAVCNLYKLKQPIDVTTLITELKTMDVFEEIGGAAYIAKLLEIPQASNMVHYAKLIKAASVGRHIISKANDIANSIYESSGNIEELLDKAQSEILSINFDFIDNTITTYGKLCEQRITQYEEMGKGQDRRIKTGFHSIDFLTGGFWGSKLIIIAARPRVGKTSLMLNMAKHMASCNHKVGIFSIEMDKESLMDRQISSLTGINSIKLSTSNRLSIDDWEKITEAAGKIYNYPVFIDDTGGLTIQELKRRSRKMVKQGVEIIFIDQLSKIRGGQGRSEYEQRSHIVNELATLKKELRIPICLLAQINRKADERADSVPTLSNLKSTGALEEDADIILIGHRPFLYSKNPQDENKAQWEVAKHREGPTRVIEMRFEDRTTTFYEETKTYN